MERGKLIAGVAVVALCSAVGIGGGLLGCAPQQGSPSNAALGDAESAASTQTASAEGEKTMEQWGELYPLQYGSFSEETIKSGKYEGHYALKAKLLAPAVRVERKDGQTDTKLVNPNGTYDDGEVIVSGLEYDSQSKQWVVKESELDDLSGTRERQGCYACKSAEFDKVYDQNGAEIFTEKMTDEFVDQMNGQVWSCNTCHDGDPGTSAPDAQLTYWTQLARDSFGKIDAKSRVCGQCHNSLDYRSRITDQDKMDSFSPYQYGFDVDSLYKAAMEDGIYTVDEETGIELSCLDHPDVEFLQGSVMGELGLTCIDCHMPETDEDGATYTYHNASNSPLENETALEYCLTCHEKQGIDSTEAMVEMVRGKQAEAAALIEELDGKFETAHELIKAANQGGGVDEAKLQQARDDYSLAEAYYHATKGGRADGSKVVHNPTATIDYYAKCGNLLDGIVASLG